MIWTHRVVLAAVGVCAAPYLIAQNNPRDIASGISHLRSLSADQRPAQTVKLAGEVSALPAGKEKLELADALSHLVTEGDQGQATIQAVSDTLSKSLAETPLPAKKGAVPAPYMDLARLAHYEHVTTTLSDPLYVKAEQMLAENDAAIAKADFTLQDLHGHKYTLSQLRGKVVLVNFWATWCPPCRVEMPALDAIYTRFQSQGLIILSISDEKPETVESFLSRTTYHPPVLIDPGDKVHKLFRVEGIPHTFVYNRSGKLMGQAIDERTEQQFLAMLADAGLQPQ
ncbi:MAG TPA: TlpA disulfide reductase family protein [Terracidiphilus sp.]|nr:TlpA disulfide reductase family protein [Terracidiphilus sp.]